MLKGAVIIVLALVVFAPVGLWIHCYWPASNPDPEQTRALFAVPEECRPEPGERLIYLSGLVLVPGFLFGLARLISRRGNRLSRSSSWLQAGLILLILDWLRLGSTPPAGTATTPAGWYHAINFFRQHPSPDLCALSWRWWCAVDHTANRFADGTGHWSVA